MADPGMVERLARVLAPHFSGADRAYREHYDAAREVLAEMREPTKEMLIAACAEAAKEQLRPVAIHLHDAELCWRAMIDAALAKPIPEKHDG